MLSLECIVNMLLGFFSTKIVNSAKKFPLLLQQAFFDPQTHKFKSIRRTSMANWRLLDKPSQSNYHLRVNSANSQQS